MIVSDLLFYFLDLVETFFDEFFDLIVISFGSTIEDFLDLVETFPSPALCSNIFIGGSPLVLLNNIKID